MNPEKNEQVSLNAAKSRYELSADGYDCIAEYVIHGDRIVFTHTFVPPELRGRGMAEKLIRYALADARTKSLKVVPACSYVATFIDRHQEYHDLRA